MARRRTCLICKEPLTQPETGRPRTYCSRPCRQRLYKRRRRQRLREEARARAQLWATPQALRRRVLAAFPRLSLDVAATCQTALVPCYLGPDQSDPRLRDALDPALDWAELAHYQACWVNPPYQPEDLVRFLAKAVDTAARCDVIGLIPCTPTARWWDTYVRDAGARWEAIPGRLTFDRFDGSPAGSAPMGVALVHWPARSREPPPGGETVVLGPNTDR